MTPLSSSSAPLRGILYMVLGGFFMTINNAMLKWVSDFPPGQTVFIRGLFTVVSILVIVSASGRIGHLRVGRPATHVVRAASMALSVTCFILGLRYLPLGETVAITFAGPLFVTALATPLLGETVGWRRWTAVVVGFVGVLIIARPTAELFQLAALLPLGAASLAALRDLLTRRMTASESSEAILMTTTLGLIVAGLCTLPFGWAPIGWEDVAVMAASGVLATAGHYYTIETFRHAETALVSPFKYLTIVWAIVIGIAVWGDIPDIWMLAGTAVVVVSGLYILHREYSVHRRANRD
jgi:drug/metabolite transporter (DMT)-like permease